MFFRYLFTDLQYFSCWILTAVFSACLHELFHALAAYYEGDDTAKRRGYFTLNPLVHMGPQSLVILFLTGMFWGSCPVNPRNFRHRYGAALVALAGPFANLLLMIVFSFAGFGIVFAAQKGLMSDALLSNLMRFCTIASRANAAFFLLNMLPLPPLDGHVIVADFFPKMRESYARLGSGGYALIMLLFLLPVGFNQFFWGLASLLSLQCQLLLGSTFGWMLYL